MRESMARHWWALALRGAVAVLFGLMAFFWPGLTLTVLVWLFGAFILIDGIFALIAAVRFASAHERWLPLLVEGIVGVLAGLLTLVWPGLTAIALVYLAAAWAILTGVLEIAAAVRLRREIANEWLLALTGVLSILLGILLAAVPAAGLLVWAWMIGAYAVLFGVLLIVLACRLRGLGTGLRASG